MGDKACQSCHKKEWNEWQGSHHGFAMSKANEETVRGDFNNVIIKLKNDTYRFYRENEKYMVEAPGPEGSLKKYQIAYTFGWEPLQQYLVDFGSGKYQVLHTSWDTEEEKWFIQFPEEKIKPTDWMHWTKQSMNWNTMCADCHSTNVKQNYISVADSFHTSWDVINVSCEACHGPGYKHIEFMNSKEANQATSNDIRKDLNLPLNSSQFEEINTCAPCHSRREKLTNLYIHGDNFLNHYFPNLLHPPEYYPDGQIKDEVFVYGSFLQSKMYTEGVKCTDCHDPHTLKLKDTITDNKLCLNCHSLSYNTSKHHFHKQNTEASQCINCHMAGRTYMGNDYRRDHSFRVPRPDLSIKFDTPNTCNNCHDNKSAAWSVQAIESWYGTVRNSSYADKLLKSYGEKATALELKKWINDVNQPELVRATLIWYAGQFPTEKSMDILRQALQSEQAIIRASASKAIENLPLNLRQPLLIKAISDSVRAVRLPATRMLAALYINDGVLSKKPFFKKALQEYKEYLNTNKYFPEGQMNRGLYYEQQGKMEKAIEAYQKSLEINPEFNSARINLAYIYNGRSEHDKAEKLLRIVIAQEPKFGQAYYMLGLLLAEQNKFKSATHYFEQASELMPEYSRLFYNWAVALQTQNKSKKAELIYKKAISLEPENSDFIYGIITLYVQNKQYKKAHNYATKLLALNPTNSNIEQLLQTIEQNLK